SMLLSAVLLAVVSAASAQAITAASSPEAVIKQFYGWYVREVLRNKDPMKAERPAMRRYVTLRLLREDDRNAKGPGGLDGDYFLDAQDFDEDWQKNIMVSNLTQKAGIATATVALKGKEMNRSLQVTLRQESGVWRIDKVKGLAD